MTTKGDKPVGHSSPYVWLRNLLKGDKRPPRETNLWGTHLHMSDWQAGAGVIRLSSSTRPRSLTPQRSCSGTGSTSLGRTAHIQTAGSSWRNSCKVKINIWMIEWLNEWMNDWLNDWMNEWLNEWLIDWMTEWMIEWMNGRKEGMNACLTTPQHKNKWAIQCEWMTTGCQT